MRAFSGSRIPVLASFVKVTANTSVHPIVPCQLTHVTVRTSTGIVGKVTAEDLWRSATSVSNAGRKRGRAKGQRLGVGKAGTVFPGLQGSAMKANTQVAIYQ